MWSRNSTADEAKALVKALRNISIALCDEAEAHAWREHEAGRLSDSLYFVVMRRIRLLSGRPDVSDTSFSSETHTTT